jgi:hypothetical protein
MTQELVQLIARAEAAANEARAPFELNVELRREKIRVALDVMGLARFLPSDHPIVYPQAAIRRTEPHRLE